MGFDGWVQDDFEVFETPGFEARMAGIRERIQPKLAALGEALLPRLEAETGTPWFAHVAKHMRRTVNPPTDTWVALNRLKRGYKATVHLGVGISALGANVCLVVKPECVEREAFAAGMARLADQWPVLYGEAEGILLGDVPNAPLADLRPAGDLSARDWRAIADVVRRSKTFEFEAGCRLTPAEAAGDGFVEAVVQRLRSLLPLYRAGIEA